MRKPGQDLRSRRMILMKKVYMRPTCSLMVIIKMWPHSSCHAHSRIYTPHTFLSRWSLGFGHCTTWKGNSTTLLSVLLVIFLLLPLLCVYMSFWGWINSVQQCTNCMQQSRSIFYVCCHDLWNCKVSGLVFACYMMFAGPSFATFTWRLCNPARLVSWKSVQPS